MIGTQIKLIISDFDGTLVDTQEANYLAYKEVLSEFNIELNREEYEVNFGFRINDFLSRISILDKEKIDLIKNRKATIYPNFFEYLKLNNTLFNFIKSFKDSGGKIALATTAQKINVDNIFQYLNLEDIFDLKIYGNDITKGKPDPECYDLIIQKYKITPKEVLIFEDSAIGIRAAELVGANFIRINSLFYEY